MAGRLRDDAPRLDELRVGDLAVRASFQVSFASLPARHRPAGHRPGRSAFRLLGLWQGPSISSAAAAALFGTPEYLAADALEILVDAHLLESNGPGQVQVPRPAPGLFLRTGSGGPARAERDAAIGRLLSWYMRTADAAATAVSPHRYNMPLDRAERWPAAAQLLRRRRGPRPGTTASAPTWSPRPARRPRPACTRSPGGCRLRCSASSTRRGNWADCIATHRIALESARRAGNRQGEAWVLNNLGEALGITRDSEGIGCLEQALAIRREIGDRMGEAQAANNLADAYQAAGPDGGGPRAAAAGPGR